MAGFTVRQVAEKLLSLIFLANFVCVCCSSCCVILSENLINFFSSITCCRNTRQFLTCTCTCNFCCDKIEREEKLP